MNWYNIKNIDSIDSPALLVYKERVQQNIDHAIAQEKREGAIVPEVYKRV